MGQGEEKEQKREVIMSDQRSDYTTQDLFLVAALRSLGFLWTHVTLEGNKFTFTFKQTPQVEAATNKFFLCELQVEVNSFVATQQAIRKLIRELKYGQGAGEVTHG